MALAAIQAVAQIISAVIPVLSCVKEAADKAESVPDFISKIENAKLPQDLTPMQAKFLTELQKDLSTYKGSVANLGEITSDVFVGFSKLFDKELSGKLPELANGLKDLAKNLSPNTVANVSKVIDNQLEKKTHTN